MNLNRTTCGDNQPGTVPGWVAQLILCLVACLGLAIPAQARDVSKRFATGANPRVELSNVSGDIQVLGWDRDEVVIEGSLANNAEMDIQQSARHITIKVLKKPGAGRMGSSELRVHVPLAAQLSLYGVSADIDVKEVRGAQRIEVVSGDIEVHGFADDVRIRSVNGDVVLRGLGHANLATVVSVSGDIDIRDVAGELEATSISGSTGIAGGEFARVRLNSTSGDVEFSGEIAPDGRLGVENISGDVEIDLLEVSDLDAEIESFSGRIRNCLGEEARRKSTHGPGKVLRFTRGEGNRALRVQALSGNVDLCTQ